MFRGFLGSFLDNMMSSHRSNIESLLDKEDTTLETLLQDSEVLTQCKWGNQRLIQQYYFSFFNNQLYSFDHDKVADMIDLIIKMPPEGCSHDRGHKLPFIASEILNCELSKLNEIFFTARPVETVRGSTSKGKGNIYDRDEEEDSENYNTPLREEDENRDHQNDHEGEEDQFQNQEEEESEFDKLIASDDNKQSDESENLMRKSFGETRGSAGFGVQKSEKARSNRYEVEEDEELDHEEIELRADETLDGLSQQYYQVQEEETQKQPEENIEAQQEQVQNDEIHVQFDDEKVEVQEESDIPPTEQQYQTNEQVPDKIEQLNQQLDKIEIETQEEEVVEDKLVEQEAENSQKAVEDLGASITDQIQEHYIDQKQEEGESQEESTQQQLQQNIDIVENHINNQVESDDEATLSTVPTRQDIKQQPPNEYELFERLLSFLDSDEELNPVLAGYFCKIFQVLVGNKPKEVFNYVYTHPEVLYNIIRHINSKSVSEVLIRLLNVSESVLDDGYSGQFDNIRQSFTFKIVERLGSQYGYEDHLNAQAVLAELVEYKVIYQELTSQRCLDIYKDCLSNESSSSSKANTYLLLQNIAQKYKSNENFSKKINFSNFQDCGDDMVLEDDEDVLVFNDDKESPFFAFIKLVIKDNVSKELAIPHEDDQEEMYPRTYGICKEPFGLVRIRAVEFLAQVYQIFFKDIHQSIADADIYNALLFFFDHYPFHNVLHQKVTEIFSLALDKNNENVVNHFLYQTSLVKKILDTSRDSGIHTFMGTGQKVNRGFMAFMRKLANKLNDLAKKNDEVQNFLESIPEWAEFNAKILSAINLIESQPLGSDPRKKEVPCGDDYFDLIYKIKDARSGFQNKSKKSQQESNDKDDDEDELPDMIDDKEDDEDHNQNQKNENKNNNEDDVDTNKDLYFNSDLAKNIGRYGRNNNRIKTNEHQQFQQQDEDDDDDDDFQRLIYKDDDDDDQNGDNKQDNGDLAQYFSNGDDQTKKPWNHLEQEEDNDREEEENPLSMNDLIQNKDTPKFSESQEEVTSIPEITQQNVQEEQVHAQPEQQEPLKIIEVELPKIQEEFEGQDFHSHFFWKVDIIQNQSIDALLQDYE